MVLIGSLGVGGGGGTLTHAFLQSYSGETERVVTHLFLLPKFCSEMHFFKMTYNYNRWKMPAFVLEALQTVRLILETVKLPFCFAGAVVAEASRSMFLKNNTPTLRGFF